jgi:restriction system protein
MFFSATKRPSSATLSARQSRQLRARRLWWSLGAASVLLALWLLWRYGFAAAAFNSFPRSLVESVNLLTFSALTTLVLLWTIAWSQRDWVRGHGRVLTQVSQLLALSPSEFEQFAAALFRARGYEVTIRGRSGDLGVDLEIVNRTGRRAIAQCKRYRATVGPDVVRELYGTMIHERVAHAFLVTTAEISDNAREWAAGKPLTLIDGATLSELANNARLVVD